MEEITEKMINDNIFNRCIFGKATKDEMISCMNYFTKKEEYEKCLVIKELIDKEYYTDDPILNEVEKINKIINEHRKDLEELSTLGEELIKDEDDEDLIDEIIKDISDVSEDIITNILKSDKLRKDYLDKIYEEIINLEIPDIKPKAKNLLENYRTTNINNIKKIIDLS